MIPPAGRGGRNRTTDVRPLMNGVMYVSNTWYQLRYIKVDLSRIIYVSLSELIEARCDFKWNAPCIVFFMSKMVGRENEPTTLYHRQPKHEKC